MEGIPFDQRNKQTEKLMESLGRLSNLRSTNEQLLQEMNNLANKIDELKVNLQNEINDYTCANISYDIVSVAPELLPPATEEIEPMKEHSMILIGKVNTCNAKNEQIRRKSEELKEIEVKYHVLMIDEFFIQRKINLAQQQLNDYNILEKCVTEEMTFIQNQKKDRKREIIQISQLLTNAQNAYAEVKERSQSTIADSKNDLTKEVLNKQNEVISLEEQIAAVRQRIYNLKVYSQQLDYDRKMKNEQSKKQADWAAEKQSLQKSLSDLKTQLNELRASTRTRQGPNLDALIEESDKLSQAQEEKYGSLLRSWSGKAHDSQLAEGSLHELWNQIQEPRKRLASLLEENSQKERALAKRKKALDRRVQIFRDTESRDVIEQEELEESFKKAESRLLAKIKQAKITLAQNRLKKL